MPFSAQVTKVIDKHQTKIATFTCADTDAPGTQQAYTWAGAGMGDHTREPTFPELVQVAGPDTESQFMITAMSKTGFTVRKTTAGAGGAQITMRVKIK